MNTKSPTEMLRLLRMRYTQEGLAESLGVDGRTIRRWENGESSPFPYVVPAMKNLLVTAHFNPRFRFIDLFAGIGGIRQAFESIGGGCVFTSEYDKFAQRTYAANFIDLPEHQFYGDITELTDANEVPDHEVLLAGFPCQPFSIAGVSKKNALGRAHGFEDETQGTLFFDVARIIDAKRPSVFLLENVRNLLSHDKGNTFAVIKQVLEDELDYVIDYRVIDSRPWVPQGRKRIIIVGFDRRIHSDLEPFSFDMMEIPTDEPTMKDILHADDGSDDPREGYTTARGSVDPRYILTPKLWRYLRDYASRHRAAGNGFGYGLVGPDDVARTLSARYYKDGSEILVDRGEGNRPRRLTPRECARLMGFDDSFVIPVSDTQAYRQFGNSVVVPMVTAVAEALEPYIMELAQPRLATAS